MSGDYSNKRCLVYDSGLFTSLAWTLAQHFGEVLYYTNWQKGMPSMLDVVVGDGYPNIRRVRDLFSWVDKVDLFVFPDCNNADLQVYLEGHGKRVWGSRFGSDLELLRGDAKDFMQKVGLPVQPHERVVGLDNLKAALKDKGNCFVKLDTFRADMETWPHLKPWEHSAGNLVLSESRLDELSFRLGSIKNDVPFLIEDEIKTKIEIGYDGVSIDGKWPNMAAQGYEVKDSGLLMAMMPYEKLPEEVREVNSKIEGFLRERRYRNFFSTEIRIGEDSLPYPIDFTCRQPCPSGEAQLALYTNLGDIFWEGAAGEMVPVEVKKKFAAEAMIYSEWAHHKWLNVEVKEKAQPFVTIFNSINLSDTVEAVVPVLHDMAVIGNEVGAVVGIGDTIEEAINHLKENAECVQGLGVQIKTDSLAKALSDIQDAQDQGMFFADEIPSPESVM